tara:strand:- start:30138 stop:31229 length:1092 start_codon:yes stop_codon:yes gene_type:complete
MAANQLDEVNLSGVAVGGQVNEDVMNAIYDVSPVDRPFCDMIGSAESENHYKEWVRESLEASSKDNARIDGSSSAGLDDTVTGERVGNYHQIMTKTVRVSDRGRNSNTIGSSDELVRQLMKRQKALRRDEEAALTSNNGAVSGNGTSTASKLAGIGAWIGTGQSATNSDRGATTGADPILSGNPGGAPTTAPVAGTKRALSEATIKTMMRQSYLKGGNPSVAMSTPGVIEKLSDYLFTSSARIATLQSDVSSTNRTDNGTGGGRSGGGIVAQGSVNILVTNFGTLELVPNRFQADSSAGAADLFLLDPDLWERSYLQGYETKELARDGLGENREISVDVTLCSLNEEGNAVIADIDYTVAAVA